jgi:hypothetical protein
LLGKTKTLEAKEEKKKKKNCEETETVEAAGKEGMALIPIVMGFS